MNKLEDEDIEFNEISEDEALDYSKFTPINMEQLDKVEKSFNLDSLDLSTLTDADLTEELLAELHLLGVEKPPLVSTIRWFSPKSHNYHHEAMVQMAAIGMKQSEIARQLGYTDVQVCKVMSKPEVKEKISKRIAEVYGTDFKQALKQRTHKAIKKLDEIIDDPEAKPQVQLQAATYIIDHVVGKAQQTVEHKGNMLSELIVKADQLRNVNHSPDILTNTHKELDNVLDEVLPTDGLVVGQRKEDEE